MTREGGRERARERERKARKPSKTGLSQRPPTDTAPKLWLEKKSDLVQQRELRAGRVKGSNPTALRCISIMSMGVFFSPVKEEMAFVEKIDVVWNASPMAARWAVPRLFPSSVGNRSTHTHTCRLPDDATTRASVALERVASGR
ncbi:hypothetical protein LX36DRAFT_441460 [Colletotrichum falcatum]|nr:hypothetical protein LX36DRAFT_441460 [Colletotrichum falcatum]